MVLGRVLFIFLDKRVVVLFQGDISLQKEVEIRSVESADYSR